MKRETTTIPQESVNEKDSYKMLKEMQKKACRDDAAVKKVHGEKITEFIY